MICFLYGNTRSRDNSWPAFESYCTLKVKSRFVWNIYFFSLLMQAWMTGNGLGTWRAYTGSEMYHEYMFMDKP